MSVAATDQNGAAPQAVAPALQQAASASQKPDVPPSEVGWLFVPQYYTFLNQNPQRLHCFYNKRSTLIHGAEQEETTPCFGQQQIHEKIVSLGFHDCKVFVSNVDSQSSAQGGIIIQVLGEMSNKAGPWRKFAQTFFLAEQPNGYFVLNDIFRFLKEEDEIEQEAEDVDEAIQAEVDHAATEGTGVKHQIDISSVAQRDATPSVKGIAEPRQTQPALGGPPSEPADPVQAAQANGIVKPQEPTAADVNEVGVDKKVTAVEPQDAPVQFAGRADASGPAAPKTKPGAAEPTPAASAAAVETSNQEGAQFKAAPGQHVPAQNGTVPAAAPAAPAAPATWANLAASNAAKWGSTVSAEARGISSAKPSNASPQPASRQANQPASSQGGTGQAHGNTQVFIKNVVTEQMPPEGLQATLEAQFGPMNECAIIANKACAFGEFATPEAARKAITMSLPSSQGGRGGVPVGSSGWTVTVEEKKRQGERPVSQRGGRGSGQGGQERGSGRGGRGGRGAGRGGRGGQSS